MKFSKQAKEAAGVFSSEGPVPAYSDPKTHPLRRALTCPEAVRETIVLAHPHVEALLVVTGGRLRVVRIPMKTYDLLNDVDLKFPVITGAIGDECQTASMVSLPFWNIFKKFRAILKIPDATLGIPTGTKLTEAVVKDLRDITCTFVAEDDEYSVCTFPIVLPKLEGVTIQEGPISSDDVLTSLEDYDSVAAQWLLAHRFAAKFDNKFVQDNISDIMLSAAVDGDLEDPSALVLTPIWREDDADLQSLEGQIQTRIDEVITKNTAVYLGKNPPEDSNPKPPLARGAPQAGPKTAADSAIADPLVSKTYRRHIIKWQLLLGVVNSATVELPVLDQEFLDCYMQPTEEQNKSLLRQTMENVARERAESRDFLKRRTTLMLVNNATASYLLKGNFHNKAFDDDKHELDTSFSMATCLPPPVNASAEVIEWKKSCKLEETEALIGEHSDKRNRLNTKSFTGGLQSDPEHILIAIANFDMIASLAADYDEDNVAELPLIVRQFGEMADLYSSPKFQRFLSKYSEKHIPHALLVQLQTIFAGFASVASNTKYQNIVAAGGLIPRSAYDECCAQFEEIYRSLKSAMGSSTLGILAQAPRSYVPPPQPKETKKRDAPARSASGRAQNDEAKKARSDEYNQAKKQGWLVLTSGSITFPPVMNKIPCKQFATIGRYCRHNPCRFAHAKFPDDYERKDQKVICSIVDGAANASFAPSVDEAKLAALRTTSDATATATEPAAATAASATQ